MRENKVNHSAVVPHTAESSMPSAATSQQKSSLNNPAMPITPAHILQLQKMMGNRGTAQFMKARNPSAAMVQRAGPSKAGSPHMKNISTGRQRNDSNVAQRFLVETEGGLFVNFVYVADEYGAWYTMPLSEVPEDYVAVQGEDMEWYYYPPGVAVEPMAEVDEDELEEDGQEGEQEGEQERPPLRNRVRGGGKKDEASERAFPGRAFSTPVPGGESTFNVMRDGAYVDQDFGNKEVEEEVDQAYYHIGTELAYTFYMSTCTAVAMYDEATGLSFLAHNDSNNEARLVQAITSFFTQARERGEQPNRNIFDDIQTDLYLGANAIGDGGSAHGSPQTVISAIRSALGDDPYADEFIQNINIVNEDVDQGTMVVVGGGAPPRVARPNISGNWEVDMAINCIFLGNHETDNGMSVLRMLQDNKNEAHQLIDDYDDIDYAVTELLRRDEEDYPDGDNPMEEEIVALYNLKKAVEHELELQAQDRARDQDQDENPD